MKQETNLSIQHFRPPLTQRYVKETVENGFSVSQDFPFSCVLLMFPSFLQIKKKIIQTENTQERVFF